MATTTEAADLEAICRALAERRPVDPEIALRVRCMADLVRQEMQRRGATEIAVDLIRELRDE